MDKVCLLLSNNYEFISFINYKKVIKLIYLNKVDIIFNYVDDFYQSVDRTEKPYPSVLKLNYPIKYYFVNNVLCNRRSLFKRDNGVCQYCSKKMLIEESTIDHIVPRAKGGKTSFLNCVISCRPCNAKKGHLDLDECNLKLIKDPSFPSFNRKHIQKDFVKDWNPIWNNFLNDL